MLQAIADTLRSALSILSTHRLRSALTLLGIVIGVVAVVAMSATITGLERKISGDLAQLGSGVFQVQKWPVGFGGDRHRAKYQKRKDFTVADVNLLKERCRQCLKVGGEGWTPPETIRSDQKVTRTPAMLAGGTVEFFDNNGYALATGRLFSEGEAAHGSDVAVLGADVADVLFPGVSPLGERVTIGRRPYRVVGTLVRRGESFGESMDNLVVLPLATLLVDYGARRSLNITVQPRDPDHPGRAQDEVTTLLRRARGVAPEDENDFEIFSNQSMQESFSELTGTIAMASIGISAIALLIGGIGVMNIMLVAVTERTGEIGLRRALGARRRRILGQFIVEAVILTIVGGLLGVALGAGVAWLVRVLLDVPTIVPPSAVALSLLVAGGVGLIFGIYPAMRAARLDPVEAMRHE
jgi:putative ABC transport system permease protein